MVMVKQITGAIARRICPWAVVGDKLQRGDRFGMIRFGSRTEMYFSLDAEVLVKVGDRVAGGETPVVKFPINP
jgi:phosphatidylserine decarboxylase